MEQDNNSHKHLRTAALCGGATVFELGTNFLILATNHPENPVSAPAVYVILIIAAISTGMGIYNFGQFLESSKR